MTANRTYFRTDTGRQRGAGVFDDEVSVQAVETVRRMSSELADAYERGWRPADLVHLSRRSKEPHEASLAATAILHDAQCTQAWDRAPESWRQELRAIAEQYPASALVAERAGGSADEFRALTAGLLFSDPYHSTYQITDLTTSWITLATWSMLTPPPSMWSGPRAEGACTESPLDSKIGNKIRGLLAKAEATEFEEEAETFTAKAQELMTRYAIDTALLSARGGHESANASTTVHSRRVHLENPYVKEKVHLLTAIGEPNRVRTVWFDKFAIATVVGTPVDLQQVDLLFTSLLVQATRAMQFADAAGRKGSRTTSFRKGFLAGFAGRIGQRLRDADTRATVDAADAAQIDVDDLLPILATKSEAVDAEFDRLFPRTKKARGRSVDAEGWHAGQAAANNAALTPGDRATLAR
ncbi:MAG: DUF2786 domain-containing protein [Rhodococcus sp.]|nr:DUF2786 domain-containing protein [Rhodococcus sp. (in: high G+C Gram-positive bacteria)]